MLLVELVLHSDFKYADDATEEMKRWISSGIVYNLQAQLGLYVPRQQRKGNLPEKSYWYREFNYWYGIEYIDYLDGVSKKFLKNAVSYAGIHYTCGMLMRGQFDIVKNGLYIGRMASLCNYNP